MNAATPASVIRIEFSTPLLPARYAAIVHGFWGVLVAAGFVTTASIHRGGGAGDQLLNQVLVSLMAHRPPGW